MSMYLIGEMSFDPYYMSRGGPLIELWNGEIYHTKSRAGKELKKLKKRLADEGNPYPQLCLIDDDKYNVIKE